MRLVWMNNTANLGESDPRYRYVPRIRDLSCFACRAHLGARQGTGLVFRHNPRVEQGKSATKRPRFGREQPKPLSGTLLTYG